ncbi:UNVERIFIED_CONTAM: hypothetical protein Slati_2061200 [Sesamum latifolium]|uniref:tRNA-uridine aminocarboxypropyltransferase n=1 Tax=Sesamum latifolium TaxID=2727402 RepID=A0AAW2WTG3_9LAMI
MVAQSGSTRRPTCPSCSKPTPICLCNRLRTPALHNSVTVTILQHSLEKKHPLNSTRIATIGLKNVDVITVSDVNFEARFFIRLLNSGCRTDGSNVMKTAICLMKCRVKERILSLLEGPFQECRVKK